MKYCSMQFGLTDSISVHKEIGQSVNNIKSVMLAKMDNPSKMGLSKYGL